MTQAIKTTLMLGTLALSLAAAPAPAAPDNCGPHADVVAFLADKYAERRVMLGLTGSGHILELYAADSGTWSVIVSEPGGLACLVASGTDADVVSAAAPASGSDT